MSTRGNSYYSSCDTCRDRKLKCSKEHPCAYCLQQAISCKYSPKVTRTALTRDNLNAAEQRIRDLETAFSILLPNANLETILASTREGTPVPLQPKSHIVAHSESNSPAQATQSENVNSAESDSEALPLEADGFDWTENAVELNELSDGMAALSIKPEGAGYLGATSSVVPLRAILGPLGNNHDINSPRAASDFPGQKMTSGDIFSMNLLNFNQTSFIDAYFQFYHTQYPFIHEPTFRAQFEGASPQPKGHSWSILLNTVLAIGAWSIGDDQSTMDDVFYNEVNRLCTYSSVFESGNLALVQALLLLSNYTQKRNRPNTGWNYLGLAVRMGLSLGLHKEFPKWEISHLQREIRRRVWWGIYIFDSGASITFGRPILLPEPGIMDTHQIMNIQENSLTPSTTSLPEEVEAPTIYSGLIAQSNFHSTIKSLYNRLLAHPEPSPQELLDLEKPIDVWEESIPAYFQISNPAVQTNADFLLSRYRLCWRSWNVRIVLFRPVILRWATKPWKSNDGTYNEAFEEIQCRQRCLENARATIESISEFMSNNISSRLGTWYLLYFLFQAGLIPIISLMTDPTHPDAPSWLELIRTTKTLLTFTSAYNQLAARCLEVVDRLCAPVLNDPEPEVMLQNPDLFDGAQAMYMGDQFGTMEFWDWSNIVLQGGGEL